ncbi:uncharacterized protein LOC124174048 [Ischnura elegans]|uniref:uncharacterized protein LOC124174048 n=1 Tax=Ischnura elegans TaxID=197161 RepID=UPI001ED8B5B4|nr:uncharacterized protein LOC124174048 [Ischnura elegans]
MSHPKVNIYKEAKMKNSHALSLCLMMMICCFGRCCGQRFSFGACPTVAVKDINIGHPGLLGPWVEWARTPNLKEHNWKCVSYTFFSIPADHRLLVTLRGHNKISRSTISTIGNANLAGTVDTANNNAFRGTLSINFYNSNYFFMRNQPVVYAVVGRDAPAAAEWITLYACKTFGFGRLEYAIILTASRSPPINGLNAALNAVTGTGLPISVIKKTDQLGC